LTAALVVELNVTESTLEVTAAASGLDEKDLMADANVCPFSSSAARSLFGVEELKNLTQLAVISAIAAALVADPPLVAGEDEADADGAAVLAAVAAAVDEEELDALLEQAARAAPSATARAGARKTRRARAW
jgi:hypothetical protein